MRKGEVDPNRKEAQTPWSGGELTISIEKDEARPGSEEDDFPPVYLYALAISNGNGVSQESCTDRQRLKDHLRGMQMLAQEIGIAHLKIPEIP